MSSPRFSLLYLAVAPQAGSVSPGGVSEDLCRHQRKRFSWLLAQAPPQAQVRGLIAMAERKSVRFVSRIPVSLRGLWPLEWRRGRQGGRVRGMSGHRDGAGNTGLVLGGGGA